MVVPLSDSPKQTVITTTGVESRSFFFANSITFSSPPAQIIHGTVCWRRVCTSHTATSFRQVWICGMSGCSMRMLPSRAVVAQLQPLGRKLSSCMQALSSRGFPRLSTTMPAARRGCPLRLCSRDGPLVFLIMLVLRSSSFSTSSKHKFDLTVDALYVYSSGTTSHSGASPSSSESTPLVSSSWTVTQTGNFGTGGRRSSASSNSRRRPSGCNS
mmetsp:Transcript_18432/g.33410  ORF Transcript_18432/g.33410 Transcript_18432/m.33410 type:complete len:214 (-) Transcript_18432:537-1178(-)